MEFRDYYRTLGVAREATADEIGRAYKKLARKFHPDLNKERGAEDRFKEINEAYEVLKDAEKRQRYDALGANWRHGAPFDSSGFGAGAPGGARSYNFSFGGSGPSGFSDFFEAVFGGGRKAGARRGAGPQMEDLFGGFQGSGQDIEASLTLTLEDLYRGGRHSFEIAGPQGSRRYDVKIPDGIRDGERVRLAGQGVSGRRGEAGDLLLTIKVAPHATFRREGDDLLVDVEVTPWDAALGTKLPVPLLDGSTVQMTLPAGQSTGQQLRLRGKGLRRKGGSHGDLLVVVKIVMPARISEEQRQLFAQLRELALRHG